MDLFAWIENDLCSENQHNIPIQDKHTERDKKVKDECADHPYPPSIQEKKEAAEARANYPRQGWHNQQLYQVLALNCKRRGTGDDQGAGGRRTYLWAWSDSVMSVHKRAPWDQDEFLTSHKDEAWVESTSAASGHFEKQLMALKGNTEGS